MDEIPEWLAEHIRTHSERLSARRAEQADRRRARLFGNRRRHAAKLAHFDGEPAADPQTDRR